MQLKKRKITITLAISIDATSVLIKKEGLKYATAATISTYDVDGNRLNMNSELSKLIFKKSSEAKAGSW